MHLARAGMNPTGLDRLFGRPYTTRSAAVVKLVDTLDLGSSAFGVGVQVPPAAPS